jgi:hypothetical protein
MKPKPPTLKTFFGDGERTFALRAEDIKQLEDACGAGIGALFKRVTAFQFRHADLCHAIRFGLIGGGETPQIAASLTKYYAENRPLYEIVPLAVAILKNIFDGKGEPPDTDKVQE